MKDLFSYQLWESVVSLWRKDGGQEEKKALSPEGREMLDQQFLVRRAMNMEETGQYDRGKAWKKVGIRAGIIKRKQHLTVKYYQWAAAAVLMIGAGLIFLYLKGNSGADMPVAGSDKIRCPQVELILASGERKILGQDVQRVDLGIAGGVAEVNAAEKRVVFPEINAGVALKYNELRIPRGGEYTLGLPDGTEVWLNAESSLRFPVAFNGDKREVFLEGEAFFKVAKDSKRPFHVHTGTQDVRVLGTSFNVCAYPTDRIWHTTLVEGSVLVSLSGKEVKLQPSYQYRINRTTGVTVVEEVDTRLYTSWMDGKFYFKNMRLEDIIAGLQRWFDMDMEYDSEEIKELRFRGTINKFEPMEKVFRNLEQITDLRFVIQGNKVTARKEK